MNITVFTLATMTVIFSVRFLWLNLDILDNYKKLTTLQKEHSMLKERFSMCNSSQTNETNRRSAQRAGWASPMVYVGDMQGVGFKARWTSQVKQDKTVFHLFKGKRQGFFVDLAANDAVALSNTLTLEQEYGWNGICIEANPMYFEQLYLRNCQVVQAAVGRLDNERVDFKFRNEFGGLIGDSFDNNNAFDTNKGSGVKTYATVSLGTVFETLLVPPVIDYMSLDIEGAEEWVFDTFPWSNYTILVMTVERPKQKLISLLIANAYVHICDHGDFGDQMWIHSSFPDFTVAVDSLRLQGGKFCSGVY